MTRHAARVGPPPAPPSPPAAGDPLAGSSGDASAPRGCPRGSTAGAHILIAEDDVTSQEFLRELLTAKGFRVTVARDGHDALTLLSEDHDLILTNLRMPRLDGVSLLKAVRDRGGRPPVIVMTAYASIESAVETTKEGAYGYIVKPIKRGTLLHLLHRALEERRLQRENALLRRELAKGYRVRDLIGKSPKMVELSSFLERIADSESTILLQGESGTGKELVARAIHAMSPRADARFVALNCGGVTETLLESELFGHVRGAFTGAVAEKPGLFQLADGGTLFLDEIGETPPCMQVKLLRALEQGELRPVGGVHAVTVNARVIAATNQDLDAAVRAGRFRADLFYRLNVIAIALPPLRERVEDIPLLVDHFLAKYSAKLKKPVRAVAPEAMTWLLDCPWPGNVRELENCIERGVVLTKGDVLYPEALPPQVRGRGPVAAEAESPGGLADVIRQAILKAMIQANGNRRAAAQALRIPERTLYRKLKAFGLLDRTCHCGRSGIVGD